MYVEKFLNKSAILNCNKKFIDENQWLIQPTGESTLFYAKIVAYDEVGVWVENPKWETKDAKTMEDQFYKINILIPWSNIISIGVFPDRSFLPDEEIDEKNISSIGFRLQK